MKLNKNILFSSNLNSVRRHIKPVYIVLFMALLLTTIGCDGIKKDERLVAMAETVETVHKDMEMPVGDTNEKTTKVAILLFPGVELLDFSGPAEVFRYTKGFEVYTVSSEGKEIKTNDNTFSLNADYTIDDAPQPDILVVPGGPFDILETAGNERLLNWIRRTTEKTTVTMSVCTGALLLSKAGVLDGKTATTHLLAVDLLQDWYPKVKFIHEGRFVQDGNILTAGGVSAGIDGSLRVVESLKGIREALNLTSIMEYDSWDPKNGVVMNMENFPLAKDDLAKGSHLYDPNTTYAVCQFERGDEVPEYNYSSIYNGEEYHFCSASCKDIFDKFPLVFGSH